MLGPLLRHNKKKSVIETSSLELAGHFINCTIKINHYQTTFLVIYTITMNSHLKTEENPLRTCNVRKEAKQMCLLQTVSSLKHGFDL